MTRSTDPYGAVSPACEERTPLLYAAPTTTTAEAPLLEGGTRWTRDNVGEVIPDPVTPLSWSVLDPLTNRSFAGMLRRLGVSGLRDTPMFGRFYGRVYLNHSLFQALMNRFYPSQSGWLAAPRLAWTGLKTLWVLRRLPSEANAISRDIMMHHDSDGEPAPVGMPQPAVFARLADWRCLSTAAMQIHLTITVLAELMYQALDKLLTRWGNGTPIARAASVTTGLTGVLSAEAGQALATLAQRVREDEYLWALVAETPPTALPDRLVETESGRRLWAEIESLLDKHGYAAVQEFELAAPRWRDDPAIILSSLQTQVRTVATEPVADPAVSRVATIRQIESQLRPARRRLFRILARQAQVLTVARENLKYHLVIAHGHLRDIYLALAVQLGASGRLTDISDIFFLTAGEVAALTEGELAPEEAHDRLTERRRTWEIDRVTLPPAAIDQRDDHLQAVAASAPPTADEQTLHGIGVSPGTYVGRARVLHSPANGAGIEPGEILIAPATSPGWAPLLRAAGALVTEIGGLLSHGAIIAREYGLPAVLNVTGATHTIRTGQLIYVDGSLGVVRLLEE